MRLLALLDSRKPRKGAQQYSKRTKKILDNQKTIKDLRTQNKTI